MMHLRPDVTFRRMSLTYCGRNIITARQVIMRANQN